MGIMYFDNARDSKGEGANKTAPVELAGQSDQDVQSSARSLVFSNMCQLIPQSLPNELNMQKWVGGTLGIQNGLIRDSANALGYK